MFISFEGIDGAGKTTLSIALVQHLQRNGVDVTLFQKKVIPSGIDPYVARHLTTLIPLIWGNSGQQPIHLLGNAYWIRLMAAYFAAVSEAVIRPSLTAGRMVVVDNWYYKFIALMTVDSGCPRIEFNHVFDGILEPTKAVYLEVDPSVAAARKSHFNASEVGWFQRQDAAREQGFVQYQSKVAALYRSLAEERGWHIVRPGHETPEELALLVTRELNLAM